MSVEKSKTEKRVEGLLAFIFSIPMAQFYDFRVGGKS